MKNNSNENGFVAQNIEQYFGTLQQSFVEVWRKHLATRSYSAHIAMNEYYDDIVDAIDALIEQYQATHGVITRPFVNVIDATGMEPVAYLDALRVFALRGREQLLGGEPELQSDVDAIVSIIDSALYKLKNLTESSKSMYTKLTNFLNESLSRTINESFKSSTLREINDLVTAEYRASMRANHDVSWIRKQKIFSFGTKWDKISDNDFMSIDIDKLKSKLRANNNTYCLIVGRVGDQIKCVALTHPFGGVGGVYSIYILTTVRVYKMSQEPGKVYDSYEEVDVLRNHYCKEWKQSQIVDEFAKCRSIDICELSSFSARDLQIERNESQRGIIENSTEQNNRIAQENVKRYNAIIAQNNLDKSSEDITSSLVEDLDKINQRIARYYSLQLHDLSTTRPSMTYTGDALLQRQKQLFKQIEYVFKMLKYKEQGDTTWYNPVSLKQEIDKMKIEITSMNKWLDELMSL